MSVDAHVQQKHSVPVKYFLPFRQTEQIQIYEYRVHRAGRWDRTGDLD